jgi:glycolate oxidase iron-sulfur subunit
LSLFSGEIMSETVTVHCDHSGDPFDTGEKGCILCGRCLEVCPLFRATGREELSPRAKFHLARVMAERPGELDRSRASDLAEICLSCGRCEKACPQELCAPHLAAELRAEHPGFETWLWKQWIDKGRLLWPAAMTLAPYAPKKLKLGRLEPAFAKLEALKTGGIRGPWLFVAEWDKSAQGENAVLFPGCVAGNARKDWTKKAKDVLAGLGYEVRKQPAWECCACTLGHAGLKETQLAMQKANLAAWRKAGRPKVVTFCATCRCGLRSYAGVEALGWEIGEDKLWLEALAPLAALWGDTSFETDEAEAPERLLYHTPCHGAGAGWDRKFLERAAGRPVLSSTDRCCGMGGVMQLSDGDLTGRVADDLWSFFDAREGGQLVTSCSGCVTQLAATAPQGVAVGHWLELLDL